MKRYSRFIFSALTAFVILGASAAASAYSDDLFAGLETVPAPGFHTVITDTERAAHKLDGVIDASAIEEFDNADKIASYEICSGNESILNVKLNDIIPESRISLAAVGAPMNGYYSVRFTLSEGDNTECFLTGLSPSNLDSVQRELILAELENTVFGMESLDFIDAEKINMPPDGDDELCWAASSANILRYTGWGEKAGFGGEDDIFDVFADNFSDVPGNAIYGLEWFFNGVNRLQGNDRWPQIKDGYGEFGGYLPEYDAMQILSVYTCDFDHTLVKMAFDSVENGSGTGISLGWYYGEDRSGGHAITMWGYICDKDFDTTDTEYYKALIISDSDSDIKPDSNRRVAPNKLHVLNISHCTDYGLDSWRFDDYYSGSGIMDGIVICKPYNDDVPKETDADASMNKFTAPDLCVERPSMASDKSDAVNQLAGKLFAENEDIYLLAGIQNRGKALDGGVRYSVTITNKADNSTVYENTLDYTLFSEDNVDNAVNIGRLDKGEYKAVFNVNPDKSQPEAYYYNNTAEYDFTVTDGIDASGVTLGADIGSFEYGAATVTLDIAGLETLDIPEGAELEYSVYALYYLNGKDIGISDVNSGVNVPKEGFVEAQGDSVIFRLKIRDINNGFPVINVYSEKYPMSYAMLKAVSETGELTPLIRARKGSRTGRKSNSE